MQGLRLPASGLLWLKRKKQLKPAKVLSWPWLQLNELSACGYDCPPEAFPNQAPHAWARAAFHCRCSSLHCDLSQLPGCSCLFFSLQVQDLGTTSPCELWLQSFIPRKSGLPSPVYLTGSMHLTDNAKRSLLSDVFWRPFCNFWSHWKLLRERWIDCTWYSTESANYNVWNIIQPGDSCGLRYFRWLHKISIFEKLFTDTVYEYLQEENYHAKQCAYLFS